MENFITDLTGTSPYDCWRVGLSHAITCSTEQWRSEHPEKYALVQQWRDRHLDNADLKMLFNACERINNARYQKTKRMNRFVQSAFNYHSCVFVTLTFSNETLSRTDETTRRKRVNEFLRPYGCYAFNLDYGKENEREHYHALVVGCERVDGKPWHKYGAIYCERVANNPNQPHKALSKYMTKLSNHATKGTTCGRVTYSKEKPWNIPPAEWWYNYCPDPINFPGVPF